MVTPTPEAGKSAAEQQPLTTVVAKEAKTTISKLKYLKLDDSSAPGMTVFEEGNNQIAILLGEIPVQEFSVGQEITQVKGSSYMVISTKGLYLAEGRSDVVSKSDLPSTLIDLASRGRGSGNVSIDEEGRLTITADGNSLKFKMTKIKSDPEQYAQMLKSAIESSRKIAQKPLLDEIERIQAGNSFLDTMIQQENLSSVPPTPAPPPPPSSLGSQA